MRELIVTSGTFTTKYGGKKYKFVVKDNKLLKTALVQVTCLESGESKYIPWDEIGEGIIDFIEGIWYDYIDP